MLGSTEVLLDLSRQHLDGGVVGALLELADEAGVARVRDAMFAGERVNATENRPALHVASRGAEGADAAAVGEARGALDAALRFADAVREGTERAADGSRFRRLAQGYHLVELAGYANCRLAKLTDRYRLCVPLGEHGAPTMDFLVQDAHQADRERPLTTLSGGETFLVSLALALALADFRAVRMPIETVLIDEGFGTLDPVTLNTVVQALETLQTSTKARVGIISHVGGLSERIGGRVLVERVAAGRSRIVVEPCG